MDFLLLKISLHMITTPMIIGASQKASNSSRLIWMGKLTMLAKYANAKKKPIAMSRRDWRSLTSTGMSGRDDS
jgi:hypothetical protein